MNNPEIQPSSTSQFEIGGDLRVLKNRIGLDFTYFKSDEGPRIFNLPISSTTGYSSTLVNGIKTQRSGFEIALNAAPFKNPTGFSWDVITNFSTFKETLKEIFPGVTNLNTFFKVGDRMDKFYGRAFVRTPNGEIVNDDSGRPVYNPVNQFLGHINPDFVLGINNRLSYKNVSMSFQFDGRFGGVISNYVQRQTYRGGRHIGTVTGEFADARYQDYLGVKAFVGQGVQVSNAKAIKYDVDGNVTNFSELTFAKNQTKQFVQDYVSRYYNSDEGNLMNRTFGMLREVVVGYNFPTKLFNNKIQSFSVSLVGRNLLYFAEKKDIDLNQYIGDGGSGLQTPSTRRYGVNLNITF